MYARTKNPPYRHTGGHTTKQTSYAYCFALKYLQIFNLFCQINFVKSFGCPIFVVHIASIAIVVYIGAVFLYCPLYSRTLQNKQYMSNSTLDLLRLAEPVFKEIDKLVKANEFHAIYDFIDRAEPPAEWVIELPSKADPGSSYKAIPLDLMEAAVRRIFSGSRITDTSLTITQDKGRFAVTAVVKYSYMFPSWSVLIGVATVTASDISMLELASPKAVSMAVKNAIKQLGGLFGKYLNRVEQAEFDIEELPKANLVDKIDSLEECLNNCKTIDELKTYRRIVSSKSISPHIQGIYENKLRELKAIKND